MLEINTLELPKLPIETDDTALFNWLSFLKAEQEEEYEMLAEKNQSISKAYGVLKELSQDERTRLLFEEREKARRDEMARIEGAYSNGKRDVAIKALKKGMSIEDIVDLTYHEVQQIADSM